MRKNKSNSGFTLVELLMVLAITAVMAGIGIATYFNLNQRNQVADMAERIVADLRSAQSNAQSQEGGQQWGMHFDNTLSNNPFYSTFYGSSYASGTVTQVVSLNGTGLSFTSPASGTSTNIIFTTPYGVPTASGSVTIAGAGASDTINVSSVGTISD